MSKTFRPWDVDQRWLRPPSVYELVPEGHLAHFVGDTVREELELSAIFAAYPEERGYPPYHPAMMTALLLYGDSRGVYSSRALARSCEERLDFMAVTAMNRPDFRTIAEFRRRHLKALGDLFEQVLKLCRAAGLVKLGHVALDGTKVQANASKHKAISYGRMRQAETNLAAEAAAPPTAARRTGRSATSPIPTRASRGRATALSRATTRRSRSMARTRSLSPNGCRPTRPTMADWRRCSSGCARRAGVTRRRSPAMPATALSSRNPMVDPNPGIRLHVRFQKVRWLVSRYAGIEGSASCHAR